VQEQFERTRRRYIEFGLDYSGTFYNDGRACTNVNLIIYDRDDAEQKQRVDGLFRALVADAKQQGYGEYRTHLSYMDEVAATFDFNDHALLRLNERVKDLLDPQGVLAPGRNGIWPAAYRDQRGRL
jgi:4-cresol dehydrogenase (hydroxylating) flavoprotein subunit